MSLHLYFHPLSSYCIKTLIAFYENDTAFEPHIVNLMDDGEREAFRRIWPIGKFPVLRDEARDRTVPESSIIIEYLAEHRPGPVELVPADTAKAREVRLYDRFFDFYVNDPMAKIVVDRMRPEGQNDSYGVDHARDLLGRALGLVEREMASKTWAVGDAFTMADCAASPALFYANTVVPFAEGYPNTAVYLDRLLARPAFARAIEEAKPYFDMIPK